MSDIVGLFTYFVQCCEEQNISPNWFSMGIHEKALEIYTAEEHDEYEFHGSMGQICEETADINQFVSSVAKQNQYYRKKSEE